MKQTPTLPDLRNGLLCRAGVDGRENRGNAEERGKRELRGGEDGDKGKESSRVRDWEVGGGWTLLGTRWDRMWLLSRRSLGLGSWRGCTGWVTAKQGGCDAIGIEEWVPEGVDGLHGTGGAALFIGSGTVVETFAWCTAGSKLEFGVESTMQAKQRLRRIGSSERHDKCIEMSRKGIGRCGNCGDFTWGIHVKYMEHTQQRHNHYYTDNRIQ